MKNSNIFSDENATVELGVGKNMVLSIKYWLQACQIIITNPDATFTPTEVGKLIFDEDGYDPYLEDEATIWLIHWLLASNSHMATSFFWFFNHFHKQEFTQDETTSTLTDFVSQTIERKISKNTLKQDIGVILRMYGRSTSNKQGVVEEALDSPLVLLQLISAGNTSRTYKSSPGDRKNLPPEIFAYALVCYLKSCGVNQIPIKELMYSENNNISLAAIFRMTENSLIAKLENIVQLDSNLFELRETAGLYQFYLLAEVSGLDLLGKYYQKNTLSKVA